MEYKDYWGFTDVDRSPAEHTTEVFSIMNHQCKMLAKHTDQNVFGIFGEMKNDSALIRTAATLATVIKSVSGMTGTTETIDGFSTKELIDADGLLAKQRYAFEICNETYRFRVFSILIPPIFPVEMTINGEVYKGIASKINKIIHAVNPDGSLTIANIAQFEAVLQEILMDKNVHYIVAELEKQAKIEQEINNNTPSKVIICEGRSDEIILHAIAEKVNQEVVIVVSDGGASMIPQVFSAVRQKDATKDVLVVVDSDGDEDGVRQLIENNIGHDGYELVIINNCIEDWFTPKVANFSKLRLMQSITAVIDEMNFDELYQKHKSFAQVIDFLNKK